MRKMTATEAQNLCELLEERSIEKSTLFTTQLPLAHWAEVIGDLVIAEAIRDRLEHAALTFKLAGYGAGSHDPDESLAEERARQWRSVMRSRAGLHLFAIATMPDSRSTTTRPNARFAPLPLERRADCSLSLTMAASVRRTSTAFSERPNSQFQSRSASALCPRAHCRSSHHRDRATCRGTSPHSSPALRLAA